jgi:hypothetical protein
MFRESMLVVAVAAIAFALPARAQDALRLKPASPWSLDYADDSCRLSRTFGAGDDQVIVGLASYEPGGRFFLSAVGNPTKTFRSPDTVRVTLENVEGFRVRYLQANFDGRTGVIITNPISIGPLPEGLEQRMRAHQPVLTYSDPAAEERVAAIGFVDGFEREFILETGSMRAPMKALKECTEELTTHWDVAPFRDLSRIAVPKSAPWTWLNGRSYPREMRQPMLINYRLTVDPDGRVADCKLAAVDAASEFAKITCNQLTKNGRFDPALGAYGEPVRSHFVLWAELRG